MGHLLQDVHLIKNLQMISTKLVQSHTSQIKMAIFYFRIRDFPDTGSDLNFEIVTAKTANSLKKYGKIGKIN